MSYRLLGCVWELTLACNLSCGHCGSRAGAARGNELSLEEALLVADQLVELGCVRVSLIGGEVFLWGGWDRLCAYLVSKGVETAIITNGTLISDDILNKANESGIPHISFSIDGLKEAHDSLRAPGTFEKAIAGIEKVLSRGIAATAITTLNEGNVSDLPGLACLLGEKGVVSWQLQLCSPFGNARHGSLKICTRNQVRWVIDFAREHNLSRLSPRIFLGDNLGYLPHGDGRIDGFAGCPAGLYGIGIDSVGNVRGCESLYESRFIEGNLREKSLREIWEDHNAFSYNRRRSVEDLGGACAECESAARCMAGCRSMNYFASGDMFTSVTCARIA